MPLSSDCANREQLVIDEGQLIAGHYRLLERVGSGSMGVVWRARDERLERVVAVKQLLLQPGLTEEQKQDARRRALREARIAAKLHHPNAIVVFDVAEHDGDPCIVMEYLDARSLAEILGDQGSLSVEEVAALGTQIASAIAVAHASGIVHRDIKPGNILITDSGIAKITDFGIARAVGDATITQTGMFAGTPAYLAPEVARGSDPTSASDVFSFGASLYDAVEGGPPFPERQNQLALLRLVAEGAVQPPRQAGELTALLMHLLRVEPGDRPSMSQASRLLADLAGSRLPATVLAGVPRNPTRPDLVAARTAEAGAVDTAPEPLATAPADPPPPATTGVPSAAYLPPTELAPKTDEPHRPDLRKRGLLIGAVLLVVVLAGLGIVLARGFSAPSNSGQASGGAHQSSTAEPPPVTKPNAKNPSRPSNTTMPPTQPDTAPSSSSGSSGTIDWQAAGNRVVAFYSDVQKSPETAWGMLSTTAQGYYGSLSSFTTYWTQFQEVASNGEYPVVSNSDGSVQVPANVVYGNYTATSTKTLSLRVIQQNGILLIDADTRVPSANPQ